MMNDMTINWVKEISPSIDMIKDKITLEKTEIALCKSWMWDNDRIVVWLKELRSWWNQDSKNWDSSGLPKLETLYPELFIKNTITDRDIWLSCRTTASSVSSLSLNGEYSRPAFRNTFAIPS